jgi:hypothetical protein
MNPLGTAINPDSPWEVTVNNVGCVYQGDSEKDAKDTYLEYVMQSQRGIGHVAGESVILWYRGEISREYDSARKQGGTR